MFCIVLSYIVLCVGIFGSPFVVTSLRKSPRRASWGGRHVICLVDAQVPWSRPAGATGSNPCRSSGWWPYRSFGHCPFFFFFFFNSTRATPASQRPRSHPIACARRCSWLRDLVPSTKQLAILRLHVARILLPAPFSPRPLQPRPFNRGADCVSASDSHNPPPRGLPSSLAPAPQAPLRLLPLRHFPPPSSHLSSFGEPLQQPSCCSA